jgi:hypothetical protein
MQRILPEARSTILKLQVEGQKLRIRVDEDELARLLAGDGVELRTQFAGAFVIRFVVRATEDGSASFAGQADDWQISLPAADLRVHAGRLPARDGLRYILPGKDSMTPLELLFDVDVRDSVRRRRSE